MTFTRKPVQFVGLTQKRCSLRYGVAPCLAAGGPRCYQTWGTCGDRDHVNAAGSITWIFGKDGHYTMPTYARDGEHIRTNPLPLLVSVGSATSEINVGAGRSGISPLGAGSTASISMQDRLWDDHVGDYYLDSRVDRSDAPFWALWRARNAFYMGSVVAVWDGYEGEPLEAMQRRDYVVEKITGPDGAGRVTISVTDPLRLAEAKEAKFPPEIAAELAAPLNQATTVVRVSAHAADLDKACGNTAPRHFLRVGSEIIQYSGHTLEADGYRTLTGVKRAVLGSQPGDHGIGDAVSRVGRYENLQHWAVAADLIDNHTRIPAGYRNPAGWLAEGGVWMATQKAERTIVTSTAVGNLLGQLCQQGSFTIWWDERAREIPLLANRPPDTVPSVITADQLIKGSASLADDAAAQISRVCVYFDGRSAFDQGKPENYKRLRLHIDGYVESDAASAAARTLTVFADWITRETDAVRLAARLLARYRLIPRYLTLDLDSHDGGVRRAIRNGDIFDVTLDTVIDAEGNPLSARWQAIGVDDTAPGHRLRLKLQSFEFVGRYSWIMPSDAPDYDEATELEKRRGCWMASAATGRMLNGDEPFLIH